MKRKKIVPIIMTGILTASSIIPVFAGSTHERLPLIALETEKVHWAQQYVEELRENYSIADILENKDLNQAITMEALKQLIRATVDEGFSKNLDKVTREAVVNLMMEIWADATGESLEELMIPMILIYNDTEEIDPQYVHNVMLAYFFNIAKGRESNLFVPKATVTYGEAITLVSKLQDAINEKNQKDDAAKEEEKKEGIFETTATYKIEENGVVFDFQLTNITDEAQDITFSSGQQYEIKIFDSKGSHLYTYSADKMFIMALTMKTIEAGETISWQEVWEPLDHDGNVITDGSYYAIINVLLMENIAEEQLTVKVDFSL